MREKFNRLINQVDKTTLSIRWRLELNSSEPNIKCVTTASKIISDVINRKQNECIFKSETGI